MLSRLELSIASLFCAKPGPVEQRNVDGYIMSVCEVMYGFMSPS